MAQEIEDIEKLLPPEFEGFKDYIRNFGTLEKVEHFGPRRIEVNVRLFEFDFKIIASTLPLGWTIDSQTLKYKLESTQTKSVLTVFDLIFPDDFYSSKDILGEQIAALA